MAEQWEMAIGGICGGLALMILFNICRRCLGFKSSGVEAGSYAAVIHSGIGDVQKGSLFAWCQRGASCCINLFLFAVGAGIAMGLIYYYDWVYVEIGSGNSTVNQSNLTDLFNSTISP